MKFLFILINLCVGCQANTLINTNFSTAWANFIQDPQLSYATYSITILDNSTGNITFSFNKDVGLAPASTLKTVTGAAALHYLGKDYRYKTLLEYSGKINSFGILNGYIYIVGNGDPSLGSWRWNETTGEVIIQRWVNLIAEKGIKHCRGIVLDLSAWAGQTQTVPSGYTWGDIGQRSFNSINGADGAFYGNPIQMWYQLAGILTAIGFSCACTIGILLPLKWTIGIRISVQDEIVGLDWAVHGERWEVVGNENKTTKTTPTRIKLPDDSIPRRRQRTLASSRSRSRAIRRRNQPGLSAATAARSWKPAYTLPV
ncbi:unnamed protein product [Rotaria sp. Silwood1]|nr:unnamed protein product [Rotaria sp. Silwood1]